MVALTGELPADERGADRADLTHRLCALTRVERPVSGLIRFVASPDGGIVPDLGHKLPGRGVWITADRQSVEAAAKAKAFARSLKRQVIVPAGLAEMVERLIEKRVIDALAIANKAGLVVTGFAQVDELIGSGRAVALLHASDGSDGGRDRLDRKLSAVQSASGRKAVIATPLTVEQMSLAIGRLNVVHAGLTRGGAAERLLYEAGRLERYRSGFAASAAETKPQICSGSQTEDA